MTEYYYLGNWNSSGVPNYLAENEIIDPLLINRIRNSLPEKKPVPTFNPSYLTNTSSRNLLIKSTDPNFNGADVWVTFIDEGAGYRNIAGYFVYDLRDNYTVPTKFNGTNWVPMTHEDRDLVDANGKSIIKKTIIFPNASLKGSGGDLIPGNRVKLLYNVNDPNEKFPNNTGIGFFLIPNGWNGSVRNANERIYTYEKFNNPAVDGGAVQTVLLTDEMNSVGSIGSFILGMEDIMRPGGDQDFNDLIIKVSYTPINIFDTSTSLNLLNESLPLQNSVNADKTGLYLYLTTATVNSILSLNTTTIKCTHNIKCKDRHYTVLLKQVLDTLVLENNGTVDYGDDVDENNESISLKIIYLILKNNIKNYNYLVRSVENKYIVSTIDPNVNNLVNFQDMYVFGGNNIVNESLKISNNDTNNNIVTMDNLKLVTINMSGPYSMGDPHIKTITGETYTIPNTTKFYELYNDNEFKLTTKLNYYPQNNNSKIYSKLTFMEYLYIEYDNIFLCIDLFNKNKYYECKSYSDMNEINYLPEQINLIPEKEYDSKILTRINEFKLKRQKTNPTFTYYSLKTKKLGNLIIEIIYIPELKDLINHVSIVSNALLCNDATGAFVSKQNIKNW